MTTKSSPRGFSSQFFLLLILPLLLLLLAISFGGVALHQSAMRNLVASNNIRSVRSTASSISERLQRQQKVMETLAAHAALDLSERGEITSWQVWPESSLFDSGLALYHVDDGFSSISPRAASWNTSAIEPALLEAIETGRNVFIILEDDGESVQGIFHLTTLPSFGDADTYVIGMSTLDSLGISSLLEDLNSTDRIQLYVVDSNGVIIYHNQPDKVGASPDTGHIQAARRGETGADYFTHDDGWEIIATYAPIPSTDWSIVQEERWQELLGPVMRFSHVAPLVMVPAVLISMLAVWFGFRQIVRPIQKLEEQASELAEGRLERLDDSVGGIEEIQSLHQTIQMMAARLKASRESLQQYVGVITKAQEDERLRLARELHDETIQTLIALGHREQKLKRYLADTPEAQETLSDLRQMTIQAVDDLRRIIRAMRPIYLEELGLLPAIETLVKDYDLRDVDTTIDFESHGDPYRLSQESEVMLYRIAQEAINNSLRHSEADNIHVSLNFEPHKVILSIEDDGIGFLPPKYREELNNQESFGLVGMYERASLVGADLQIKSNNGKGTVISVCINE